MSTFSEPDGLGSTLAGVLKQEPSVLFAGAGVSAHAGLPVWGAYLEYLATVVEPRERLIAALIRKRISEGSLLLAAHYYKTCTELPKGERYAKLAEPFQSGKYNFASLSSLASLPFTAIVTTNYDRALHDACASVQGKAALNVELNDASMTSAFFTPGFFIARIHGRAEIPQSIVLDDDDYKQLYVDVAYNDFLHSLLMQRRCIFVGFSFADPAISRILGFIAEKGVLSSKKHFALVPKDAIQLTEQMSNQNIELILYDPRENHRVLWEGIEKAKDLLQTEPAAIPQLPSTFETSRRLLAVCYARSRAADQSLALRSVVVQGIVISEIEAGTTTVPQLAKRLQTYIALKPAEATGLVSSAVDGLVEKGLCLSEGQEVILVEKPGAYVPLSPSPILATAIINRLVVRDQYDVKPEIRSALERIVEEVLLERGFDLGAEFAGATLSSELDPSATIARAIERNLPQYWQDRKAQIAAAFLDLIRRPTPKEEEILAEAGRISFGIEMVLQVGRATMYQDSLPDMVYLDASVLMPAIVPGHPYQRAYVRALEKLQQALESEGTTATILVADVFLNEIVTHRKKAISIAADFGLEDREMLTRRIQYYGADNVNVFIGAYSTWVAKKGTGTFAEFLAQEAPYSTEEELVGYLKEKGIRLATTKPRSQEEVRLYEKMKDSILDGYDRAELGWKDFDRKALVLKKHEAAQVALLLDSIREGRRAVLVTADKALRSVVSALGIRELRDALISHRNLIQLVDLLVGVPVEAASLSRLLWAVRAADDRSAIKDYLINRAIPQYDAALTLKMSDLLDRIMDRVMHEAKLERISFGSPALAEKAREVKFMDRIEAEVFEQLAEEVKELRKELKNTRRIA